MIIQLNWHGLINKYSILGHEHSCLSPVSRLYKAKSAWITNWLCLSRGPVLTFWATMEHNSGHGVTESDETDQTGGWECSALVSPWPRTPCNENPFSLPWSSGLPFPQRLGEPKYVLPGYFQAPAFSCHPLVKSVVPNLFGTRDQFPERKFFRGPDGAGEGFWMIQTHYISCALYFYYYYQFHLRSLGIRSQRLGTPALNAKTFEYLFLGLWGLPKWC